MPTSKEAANVKQMVEAARREFARTLPARPLEDQSVKLEVREAMEKLQRENDELRAQIATLRGNAGAGVGRVAPVIELPGSPPVAPVTGTTPASEPLVSASPVRTAPPVRNASAAAPTPPVSAPVRPTPSPATPPRTAPPAGGRTHTVQPKETLYGISVLYYGHGRNVRAIYQANRDSMRSETDVRPGMVLKIPPVDGVAPRR
jgi:nucleoid-associated protein YgaU